MNIHKKLSDWLFTTLSSVKGSTAVVNGHSKVYPIVSKEEVEGAFIIYDSLEVVFAYTKDGAMLDAARARVLTVEKSYTASELLGDAVEAVLHNASVPTLGDVHVTSRKSVFDERTGEFVEEILIQIDL